MKDVGPSLLEAMLSWCRETDPREASVFSCVFSPPRGGKFPPWACDLQLTLGSPSWRDRAKLKKHSAGSLQRTGSGFSYGLCKLLMHVNRT